MNIIHTNAYRTAFVEYLRRGTPIRLSQKETGITDRYVWHAQRDERVRPSHWMNDGRIFSWSNPALLQKSLGNGIHTRNPWG